MRKQSLIVFCAALLAVSWGWLGGLGAAQPPPRDPIALVGGIRIEEADIQRAARVMAADPLRTKRPTQWRKKLLDHCIDRELLAIEAERRGMLRDPRTLHDIESRSASALYAEIRDRVLLPAVEPTPAQIDTARAGRGFRRAKLRYMLSLANRKTALGLVHALRGGASFDSIARIYSIHPSAREEGGHVGWLQVRFLNPTSKLDVDAAKPGDILGPYQNDAATEIYAIDAIEEPTDPDIRAALIRDRSIGFEGQYRVEVLSKYRFALVPNQVSPVIFAAATEHADSILASLAPDGTRSERGVRPALGALARADGDSITYRDIATPEIMPRASDGKAHIEDTQRLLRLCAAAILPRLVLRDARDRGIDKIPEVARRLRLIREEASTRAMVARAVPTLRDSPSLRAYFESHAELYHRPPVRRAIAAVYIKEDSARAAGYFWSGIVSFDSSLIAQRFRRQEGATVSTLLPGYHAILSLFETDTDELSVAARGLDAGKLVPVVRIPHGYALALVLGSEPARPLTLAEAGERVAVDLREDRENAWIVRELKRLRAATPAQRFPARLAAVRLGDAADAGGARR